MYVVCNAVEDAVNNMRGIASHMHMHTREDTKKIHQPLLHCMGKRLSYQISTPGL
jgi:hypothetical protein